MPELPEVETVAKELTENLANKTISKINTIYEKVFNETADKNKLIGLTINDISRRAKYLIFNFDKSDLKLISHLRMTGKYSYNDSEVKEKFVRCSFEFTDKSKAYYEDMRKFGRFDITNNIKEYFNHIGVEPLSNDLNINYLKPLLQRNKPIKNFLMDQTYIAGLGNIYSDESLFLSKILPTRSANDLTDKEIKLLIKNIKIIISNAIEGMGTILAYYQKYLNTSKVDEPFFQVYGRKGKECNICKTEIEKIKMAGRGTHFCPKCQK